MTARTAKASWEKENVQRGYKEDSSPPGKGKKEEPTPYQTRGEEALMGVPTLKTGLRKRGRQN